MSNARDDASSHATLAYGLNLPKKKPRGTSGGETRAETGVGGVRVRFRQR